MVVNSLLSRAWVIVGLSMVTASLLSAGRQQPPASSVVDVETLGPKVGATVPDFTLHDQTDQARALSSLLGPKGAILVFFRSADW